MYWATIGYWPQLDVSALAMRYGRGFETVTARGSPIIAATRIVGGARRYISFSTRRAGARGDYSSVSGHIADGGRFQFGTKEESPRAVNNPHPAGLWGEDGAFLSLSATAQPAARRATPWRITQCFLLKFLGNFKRPRGL